MRYGFTTGSCAAAAAKAAAYMLLSGMEKTEINLSVFHNGAYVGCSHRNEIEKHIFISPNEASDGFIPWNFRGGILRVVLHVYQILNDHTPYELTISGKEGIE